MSRITSNSKSDLLTRVGRLSTASPSNSDSALEGEAVLSRNLQQIAFQRMASQAGGDFRRMEAFLEAVSNPWTSEGLVGDGAGSATPPTERCVSEPVGGRVEAASDCITEDIRNWVTANRLETWMGSWHEGWKENYLQNWLRVKQHLQVIGPLTKEVDAADIRMMGYRGPFAGLAIADDPALSYFTDLDVLVDEKDLETVYEMFRSHGFALRTDDMPKSFYRKHHLHYALQHAESGVLCDLHWAVDHPYTQLSIPYAEILNQARRQEKHGMVWWEPIPVHRYVLAALHAMKHFEGRAPDSVATAVEHGQLRFLLEGMALRSEHPDVETQAERMAVGWNAADAVNRMSLLLHGGAGSVLPRIENPGGASLPSQRHGSVLPSSGRSPESLTARHGFRLSRARELGSYLWPATLKGRPTRWTERLTCVVQGGAKLAVAAVDFVGCACRMRLKALTFFFLVGMLISLAGHGHAECPE